MTLLYMRAMVYEYSSIMWLCYTLQTGSIYHASVFCSNSIPSRHS